MSDILVTVVEEPILVEVVETGESIAVTPDPEVIVVTAVERGPAGPAGPTGPSGPPGGSALVGLPIVEALSVSNLASGASADMDTVDIAAAKVGRLWQIDLSSSAAAKWVIKKVDGAAEVVVDVVFTGGLSGDTPTKPWQPPSSAFVEQPYVDGNEHFRVTATNLDANWSTDFYASVYWEEADA